ncbi:hypothetical protein PPL_06012 [Heterostelium album PN500]|uniref:Uncharacterized protein n=1 Tax=Heterostelium pallidum (strain ATCC 26659 / Pp 5 / PN500) TaxID=670386 RepID=D3BBZ2_HETP5|nr:hypothetical protein PPL_06012 [Heterostelium album PN500]EFA81175.1 hypothetical protein PPL_06012 [Heterostelium album PN500]|eukprot:XP_020433293.1 hypothetical protein PPL_06012 [Heterostelium album PN500]
MKHLFNIDNGDDDDGSPVQILALTESGCNITYFNVSTGQFESFFSIAELVDRDYQQIFIMNSNTALLLGNQMNSNNQLVFGIDILNMKSQELQSSYVYGIGDSLKYIWTTAYMNVDSSTSYYYVIDTSLTISALNTLTGDTNSTVMQPTKLPAVNQPAGSSEFVIYLPEIDIIYIIASYDPEQSSGQSIDLYSQVVVSGDVNYRGEHVGKALTCSKYQGCTYLFTMDFKGNTIGKPLTMIDNWIDKIGYPTFVTYLNGSGDLLFTGFDGTSSYLFSLNPTNGDTQIVVRFPTMEFPTSSAILNDIIYVLGGSMSGVNQSTFVQYNLSTNQILSTTSNIKGNPGQLCVFKL